MGLLYTGQVRLNWKSAWLAMLALPAILGTGCSGINAGGSVSPASFFLPGLLKADLPSTNAPAALPGNSQEVALTR